MFGVCSRRNRLSGALEVTHRFDDRFELIVPHLKPGSEPSEDPFDKLMNIHPKKTASMLRALGKLRMIQFSAPGETGAVLERWIQDKVGDPSVAMQAGSFDLVINLVSMGFGWSIVPQRSLAIYGKRKPVRRMRLLSASSKRGGGSLPAREIIIVTRRDSGRPAHLSEFVDRILF